MAEVYITCSRCKAKVPMKGMKYNEAGDDLICQKCYAKANPSSAMLAKKEQKQHDEILQRTISIGYVCTSCGYRFHRDINYKYWQKCPWCEKLSVRKDVKKSATEVIKEAQQGEKAWKY